MSRGEGSGEGVDVKVSWTCPGRLFHIIMIEFKCISDTTETYYSDMKSIVERQHTPILERLNTLVEDRGWVTNVLPLEVGHRSGKKSG